MFGKKPSVTTQAKAHSRELKTTDRELVRDRRKLEAEEQRLKNELRKSAATNNKQELQILAKQLVQIRKQKEKSLQASGQIQSVAIQSTMMASNTRVVDAMKTTSTVMAKMNKIMNPEEMSKITEQYAKEHMKFSITDDMIGETLEAALGQEGDTEEEDEIIGEVLGEIGISINNKILNAPRVPGGTSSVASSYGETYDDAEIEGILANTKL